MLRKNPKKDRQDDLFRPRLENIITPAIKKRMKRRNTIEPVIGHCKNDRKVGPRNWLKGRVGDKINAISMAIGFNMRNILRKIFLWLLENLFMRFNPRKYQGPNSLFRTD